LTVQGRKTEECPFNELLLCTPIPVIHCWYKKNETGEEERRRRKKKRNKREACIFFSYSCCTWAAAFVLLGRRCLFFFRRRNNWVSSWPPALGKKKIHSLDPVHLCYRKK